MQLQIARRLITVGARLRWVAIGAAVLLGNATATADCSTPYNGGCKVALGSDRCEVTAKGCEVSGCEDSTGVERK